MTALPPIHSCCFVIVVKMLLLHVLRQLMRLRSWIDI